MLDFSKRARYNDKANRDGRLAQLVAHPLDVREVTSSSLVSSTKESASKDADFFNFGEISNFSVQKVETALSRFVFLLIFSL